ncbi:Uncharacterised protein [Achromobacter xylosoxidans]|nr:Uncharacterised protein [Achromobacter xylosoxidans]
MPLVRQCGELSSSGEEPLPFFPTRPWQLTRHRFESLSGLLSEGHGNLLLGDQLLQAIQGLVTHRVHGCCDSSFQPVKAHLTFFQRLSFCFGIALSQYRPQRL